MNKSIWMFGYRIFLRMGLNQWMSLEERNKSKGWLTNEWNIEKSFIWGIWIWSLFKGKIKGI
jgi:hypothetical protein